MNCRKSNKRNANNNVIRTSFACDICQILLKILFFSGPINIKYDFISLNFFQLKNIHFSIIVINLIIYVIN